MECKICGQAEGNRTYRVREMMFGMRDEFTYLECSRCGCVQLVDPPDDLGKYYPPNYYSLSESMAAFYGNPIKDLVKRWRFTYAVTGRGLLGRLAYDRHPAPAARTLAPVGIEKDTRILDVGCGTGALIYALYEAGYRNVLGVDPYVAEPITYANGMRVLKRPIHEVEGQWDLVMLHHSFEHMPDQRETISACAQLLAPRGTCLIRVPVASSYAWHHYRENWVSLDAPRHFFLHTEESIRLLASEVGLRVAEVVYDSCGIQFWGSEQYQRDLPLEAEGSLWGGKYANPIFTPAEVASFEAKARELNDAHQGDQACFYLRA